MNYLSEIRMFYDWLQFNSIPDGAQALWHCLMYLNNKCALKAEDGTWGWRVEFTVSNTTILSILKFSAKQLHIMRNVLIQSGRIRYEKGKGNQSGTYQIIPFDCNNYTQIVIQTGMQSGIQIGTQVWIQTASIRTTLINNNVISNSNIFNDGDDDVRARVTVKPEDLFSEYFGRSPTVAEIRECERLFYNFNPDLVVYAFGRAGSTDNKNISYVTGILLKLADRKVIDMESLAVDHMRRKDKRG